MDNDYSLIPPPLLTQLEEEEEDNNHGHGGGVSPNPNPSWVLLDRTAYISVAAVSNSTTAVALMSTGQPIHFSVSLGRPPLLSYFCAHFPGPVVGPTVGTDIGPAAGTPAVLCVRAPPVVLTTHANLALLRVPIPGATDINDDDSLDYFVYTARPHGGGASSLLLLPRPTSSPRFRDTDVAILPVPGGGGVVVGGGDRFVIAALRRTTPGGGGGGSRFRFRLERYDSDTGRWTMTPVTLPQPAERDKVFPIPDSADMSFHNTSKVIHLTSTTVGWVDLWRGILFCDVLDGNPVLGDMPLPKPARSNRRRFGIGGAGGQRDVTVVLTALDGGEVKIKYVEMESRPGVVVRVKSPHHSGSGSDSDDDSEEDEIDVAYYWKATVWSMPVPMSSWKDWRKECTVDVADTTVQNPEHCKVLLALPTRLSTDPQDDAAVSFRRLCTAFPTLGLGVDDGELAIYFSCKVDSLSPEGWVVQVGVKDNKLQGIAKLDDRRNSLFLRYYSITDISKYLSRATGAAGALVRARKHYK